MKRTLLLLTFLAAFFIGETSRAQAPTETVATLQERIKTLIDQPRFAQAQWGVKVVSLDSGNVLFDRNGDKLMKPASNTKMYSGSLALDRLGPDFKIRTSFYADAKPDAAGKIHGNLTVYGRGDPSYASRFNNDDYTVGLQKIVNAVTAAGIKEVEGDLIGDESYFRGPPYGTDWAVDDLQEYYGALSSSLMLEDNVVDWTIKAGAKIGDPGQLVIKPAGEFLKFENRTKTIAKDGKTAISFYRPLGEDTVYFMGDIALGGKHSDSVAVHRSALWYVTLLKEALAKQGVKVDGGLRTRNWLDEDAAPIDYTKQVEVAAVEGAPLSDILAKTLKPSQNLYAHTLLLLAGKKAQPASKTKTSQEIGLAEMEKFLGEVGIKKGRVMLEEGSGLSRGCLLTPASSVTLLTFMTKHKSAKIFYDDLPIAGVDGSLRTRFKGTAAENNVHAKTGSLEYVNTISGYVTNKAGEKLVFSVMLNNYNGGGRAEADKVVLMLAEWSGKSGN